METSYILFKSGGLYFLVPLEAVVSVESQRSIQEEETPFYNFGQLCKLQKESEKEPYVLLLCSGESRIGLAVDQVEGIREVNTANIHKLPKLVITPENRYLDGVVSFGNLDPPLAYLLEMPALFEKLADCAEETGQRVLE